MNFTRPSQLEDLLFVIVLLLPPVFAGARYIESVRQFGIEDAMTRAAGSSGSVRGRLRVNTDAFTRARGFPARFFVPGRL
jgi:hypothetical protein